MNSKNDKSWEEIFVKHKIVENILASGFFHINSTEINLFREARLMTKFDHKSQLPKIFAKNKLSILPISRGGYVIGSLSTFHNFEKNELELKKIRFPNFLESLNHKDISSESTAINCAFVSGILNDFTGEKELFPTVSGRMSSNLFDFKIDLLNNSLNIKVVNSQIEIDGGFEGDNSLSLIEAKNYLSDDFLVRQLFYPYKLWSNKIGKKVRPIFLTFTNGIYHLREYIFQDPNHYNSLILVKENKYTISDEEDEVINNEVIQKILEKIKVIPELNIPFPQADSFERVINLCELLKLKNEMSKEEITLNYDFDLRQTDYYTNAGKYLGLIETKFEKEYVSCYLTDKGKEIFNKPIRTRQLEFVRLILSHQVFKKSLGIWFNEGNIPSKDLIVEIMKSSKLYDVNADSTYYRRASTISGWINWIMNLIEE